jgi:hypothetical protein
MRFASSASAPEHPLAGDRRSGHAESRTFEKTTTCELRRVFGCAYRSTKSDTFCCQDSSNRVTGPVRDETARRVWSNGVGRIHSAPPHAVGSGTRPSPRALDPVPSGGFGTIEGLVRPLEEIGDCEPPVEPVEAGHARADRDDAVRAAAMHDCEIGHGVSQALGE